MAAVVVLAAGEGTRMRSATPKVLHEVGGRTLLGHVVTAARALQPEHLVVVVGHAREQVTAHLAEVDPQARAVVQEEQNGTGHAVRVALDALQAFSGGSELSGTVVIVPGDAPLLRGETLADLVARHHDDATAATLLTAELDDPTGYGRVLRGPHGAVTGVVEHRDATDEQRAVREVNTSVYAFASGHLRRSLQRLTTGNSQGEEYLTDVVGLLVGTGLPVGAVVAADATETAGVNDRVQLSQARAALRDRLVTAAQRAGADVVDPASTWLDVDVACAPDSVVLPGTSLLGRTRLAAGAVVGPHATLRDTSVGEGATVAASTCSGADIGPEATVGPYSYLRPGTRLGRGAKVGAFVETKAADLGDGAKVPHLSYVGDATVGAGTNVGAATVVVNYDGQHKHHTVIGDHVRIGSDTMLVAPVSIGDGAYTAAGSVVTGDVPPGALAVARGRQRTVEGWVARKRPGTPSAEAAARAQQHANGPQQESQQQEETHP